MSFTGSLRHKSGGGAISRIKPRHGMEKTSIKTGPQLMFVSSSTYFIVDVNYWPLVVGPGETSQELVSSIL